MTRSTPIPAITPRRILDVLENPFVTGDVHLQKDGEILGFAGLDGEYIEGIFVAGEVRSHGIGKSLLDFLKTKKAGLCLNVYQKNTRAIRFYEREGFQIQSEGLDEATGEKDYVMVWHHNEN